jgi:hypothetical protein
MSPRLRVCEFCKFRHERNGERERFIYTKLTRSHQKKKKKKKKKEEEGETAVV